MSNRTPGGWDTALEAQNELRYSLRSYEGQRYLETYGESMIGKGQVLDPETGQAVDRDRTDEAVHEVRSTLSGAVASVEYGDPMWVSSDVIELVSFASETFEPEAVYPDDLFTPNVFAYLQKPIYIYDRNRKTMAIRAISWLKWQAEDNPGRQGVLIALWSHVYDEDDFSAKFREAGDNGLSLAIGGSLLTLNHVGRIPFGDARMMSEPSHHSLFKALQVLWRLAKQEIVVPGRQQVSRPVWRRKSNWRQIKHVQVLALRRAKPKKPSDEISDVEWSHRWPVRGHWRNQWYPRQKRHYQIWIDPFIKGPEDKPFIAKQRAIEFFR